MAQIGTIRFTAEFGTVSLPVHELSDKTASEFDILRVQTDSGVGYVPCVDSANADLPYIRIQTENNGIVSPTTKSTDDFSSQ